MKTRQATKEDFKDGTVLIDPKEMKKWSWKDESDLMEQLESIQNSGGKFDQIDIMTIVGFMRSRDELVRHINDNGGNAC